MGRARGPVGHTCPDIDRVIGSIPSAAKELDGLESILESLRSDNDALRSWGAEQEDKVAELEDELDTATKRIAELESELSNSNQ